MSKQCLQILTLKQIPTSVEIIDSLKSLQKISPIDIESNQFKQAIRTYGEDHLILYKQSTNVDGHQNYLCFRKEQQIGQFYANQSTGELFKLEQLNAYILERKKSEQIKLSESNQTSMNLLKSLLNQYLHEHFSKPYGAAFHLVLVDNNIKEVLIGLTNKSYNIGSFYSGQWSSFWSFKEGQCEGRINVKNHYFQNGNALFERKKPISKTLLNEKSINLSKMDEKEITKMVQTIKQEEEQFQRQLQQIFSQSMSKALKKVRRISSITQGKMIWNINAVLLSRNLKQQNQQLSNES